MARNRKSRILLPALYHNTWSLHRPNKIKENEAEWLRLRELNRTNNMKVES